MSQDRSGICGEFSLFFFPDLQENHLLTADEKITEGYIWPFRNTGNGNVHTRQIFIDGHRHGNVFVYPGFLVNPGCQKKKPATVKSRIPENEPGNIFCISASREGICQCTDNKITERICRELVVNKYGTHPLCFLFKKNMCSGGLQVPFPAGNGTVRN
ncbi:hypothetical protein [Escherichia coli]|uniref:hypothetical protein n=1 Tax=Escherichia coli TaxID=562 RepID=UPI0012FF829A|nr:hypothetical protein [Escherichia coli]